MEITNLRCEYKINPVGIDVANPRLSWQINSDQTNIIQKSYRVLVSKYLEEIEQNIGDTWDSGIINSNDYWCEYKGPQLTGETKYFWKIFVAAHGNASFRKDNVAAQASPSKLKRSRSIALFESQPANFITGLIEEKWDSEWIRFFWNPTVPLIKKELEIKKEVKQAVIYGSALGIYDLYLNSERVGDCYFTPGWTDYRKRVYYNAFDVTEQLKNGKNEIRARVAPGWYAGFIGPFEDKGYYGQEAFFGCRLRVDYLDGTYDIIKTDKSWQATGSSIQRSDLLHGETYEAGKKLEQVETLWGRVVTPDSSNFLPEVVQNYPGLTVKKVMELKALSIDEPVKNRFVFDLGQNMVGICRYSFNDLKKGQTLEIKYGEMLNDDGTVYTDNLRSAQATDRYIAKGLKEEIWEPSFTFHGFRYVEINGLEEKPSKECVTGIVLSSMHELAGNFECGISEVNQLYSNIIWGLRGNYFDIPTDCPQRDERLGWTGDAQMFIKSASYITDIAAFFRKWLVDLDDARREDGAYPDTAPTLGRVGGGAAAWGDAGIICPYILWKTYGDTEFIKPFWTHMKEYMDFLYSEDNSHNSEKAISYGDWLSVNSETPVELIGLAYRAYDSKLMAEMAKAVKKKEDADFYERETEKSVDLFGQCFFDANQRPAYPTQTACALAIYMELLEGEELKIAADTLVEQLKDHNGYLSTGFVGTGYLCPALAKIGRHDLAVQLLLNDGYPSWLYEVKNGATTIWERWNSWTFEHGFGDVNMNSFNHYAFGAVCEWMFGYLGGIQPLEPGYKKILIAPKPDKRLGYVKTSYDCAYGRIVSEWKCVDDKVEYTIEIPIGATAEIILKGNEKILVGSGNYNFKIKLVN